MKGLMYTLLLFIFFSSNVFSQTAKVTKPPTKKTTTKTAKTSKAPVKNEPVFLLVKIKSDKFTNDVGAMSTRAGIEDKIDDHLTAAKNGEWVSGDSGPGEINMLFKVMNVETAKKVIIKIVNEEKFDKTLIIGIRTFYEKGQSKYKAIYPVGYKGAL